MILKKHALLLGMLLFGCLFSFAQRNLQDGFVVLNNGDTLKGFINYREWYKNPASIMFSTAKGSGMQRYKPQDITCFAVNEREMYQRYFVRISMDRQLVGNIGEKDTSGKKDTVFLKVLQTGKNVTLFSYSDDVKKRFYILPANESTPVELQNSEYLSNGQVITEKEYRSILVNVARKYVPGNAAIETAIYNKDYSQTNILDICYQINGTSREVAKPQVKGNKPSGFRFYVGTGVNRGNITVGNNHYAGKTSGVTYGPTINAGADILVNPVIGRLFLRSQLTSSDYKVNAYTYVKYFEAKENYYFSFKQHNIALHEQLNYNLYNGQYFKWYVGAGAGVNFSSYPKNEEKLIREGLRDTTTSINGKYIATIKNFWLNTIVRSGFTIRNVDVSLAYYPKTSLSQNDVVGLYNSSLQLQLNYLFIK